MKHFVLFYVLLISVCSIAQTVSADIANSMVNRNYEHAIELLLKEPNLYSSPILLDKLGESYAYQEDWDKAIATYKKLTSLVEHDPIYFFKYGGVLAKKAQSSNPFVGLTLLGRIKSSFNKTLTLNPNHIGAHWALIDLYVSLPGIVGGSYNKAYELAKELKTISPLDGYLAMGYIYEYDGEPLKAKSSYFQALDLVREGKEFERNQLNYQLGKVYGDYGVQLDKGINYMARYIANYSIKDGVPLEWAYYRMALLYRKKGNKPKSLFWINKTLRQRADFKRAQEEKQLILGLKE